CRRAEQSLSDATRALAQANEAERYRTEALAASIRNGATSAAVLEDDNLTGDKDRARRAVETAQTVVNRFQEELRIARAKLSERNSAVGAAALKIVVAVMARE